MSVLQSFCRVKLFYLNEIYSLGYAPRTFEDLVSAVKNTIKGLVSKFQVKFRDQEGEDLLITTSEALKEAYQGVEVLKLWITASQDSHPSYQPPETEFSLPFQKAWECLRPVFSIVVEGICRGVGILINMRIGLTTSKVISSHEEALQAFLFFEDSSSPLHISSFFVISEPLVFFSLNSTYSIAEVTEVFVDPTTQIESQGVTLDKPRNSEVLSRVKWVTLKEALAGRIVYETHQVCGLAGSPVYSCDWKFLGIQLSHLSTTNEALSSAEVLNSLKLLPYSPKVVKLIQFIEPIDNYQAAYQETLLSTPSPEPNRVYGVTSERNYLQWFNYKTSEFSKQRLKEKLGEGSSVCVLPNGVLLTGGKTSLRKAWLGFFQGEITWFELEMPQAHQFHCSVYFEGKVLLIGGKNSARPIRFVESFDYYSQTWESLAPLRVERACPAVCEHLGKVYVFGGRSYTEDLDTIEVLEGKRWKLFSSKLPFRLFGAQVLFLRESEFLVLGGKSHNTKFNQKIVSVDFTKEEFEVLSSEHRIGMCSGLVPCYSLEAVYFFNNEGSLIKFCRQTKKVFRVTKSPFCNFE